MAKPLTFEDIFEALSPEDQEELSRPSFKVGLELYLKGYNKYPVVPHEIIIEKFRYVLYGYIYLSISTHLYTRCNINVAKYLHKI